MEIIILGIMVYVSIFSIVSLRSGGVWGGVGWGGVGGLFLSLRLVWNM